LRKQVFFQLFSNFSKTEILLRFYKKFTILETVSIAEPLQNPQHAQNPLMLRGIYIPHFGQI